MSQYKTLLFDLDDTILDFGAAEKYAFRTLMEELQVPYTEELVARYKKINHALWDAFEEGVIEREEVTNTRFAKLFAEYGKQVDGIAIDLQYRSHLEECIVFVDGALELIETLHGQFDLYITSNGVSSTQAKRMRLTGLDKYFKNVFVSEAAGAHKPMKEFFDYVFHRIPNFDSEKTMIIGDSLTADVRGGFDAGIATCWLNPEGKPNTIGAEPTYNIRHLNELYKIIGVKNPIA